MTDPKPDLAKKPDAEAPKPDLKLVSDQPKGDNPGSVFDNLDSLRKEQKLTVKRKAVLVNVTVDKPANNVFFRSHPEHELQGSSVLQDRAGRAYYYVVPAMRTHPKLEKRVRPVTLGLICTWPGNIPIIWPVSTGDRDFKVWKSARKALELSKEYWTQIVWDEENGDYVIETAEDIHVDPIWPEQSFEELLKLGFDGKIIDNEDHPYVRRLRGLD
jgi:hypothetical protein